MTLQSAVAGAPAAMLEAALVLLPSSRAFGRLAALRSPLWTALLPGSIIIGTFGLLALPSSASGVLVAAALTTPVLAALAVVWVVRAPRLVAPIAAVAGALALSASGLAGHLGTSVIMALACLTIGTALQRLIPRRWLLMGVLAMAVADVALLASSYGYHQTAVLAAASNNFHGPSFTGARVGRTTIGYPDLFLAALLGASLAGTAAQRRAAVILGVLVIGYDSTLHRGEMLPATVPIAATLLIVTAMPAVSAGIRRVGARLRSRGDRSGDLHRSGDGRAPGGARA